LSDFISKLETPLMRYRLLALLTFTILASLSIKDLIEPSSIPIVQWSRFGAALILLSMTIILTPRPWIIRHLSILVFLTLLTILTHLINVTWQRSLPAELVIMNLVVLALVAGITHSKKLCLAIVISWTMAFATLSVAIPNPIFSPIYFMLLVVCVSLVSYSLLAVLITAQERLDAKERILLKTQTIGRMAGWEFDESKNELIWSQSAYKLLGIENDNEVIDVASLFKSSEEFVAFELQVQTCIRHCEELNTTVAINKVNGQNMWVQCRGDVILRYDKPVGMAGVIIDVTENVARERELVKAKELAETAAEARTRFLANMSHEIRTPMNGVIGMTSILLSSNLSEKERSYVEIIRRSGEALLIIINEILDFSKYESGSVELDDRNFSMDELASDALDAVATQVGSKGLKLYLDMPLLPHLDYIGDSSRLRQVLVNLLGNAVKFTEEGHVALNIKIREYSDTTAYFEFEVSDTGIGIAHHNIAHLFDPFTQEDASTTRRFGGTGLGLAISNEIINAMNGHIKVTSTLRKGSTFSFSIKIHSGEKRNFPLDHLGHIALLSKDAKLIEILSKNIAALGESVTGFESTALLLENNPVLEYSQETKRFSSVLIDTEMDEQDTIKTMIGELEIHFRSQLVLIGSVALDFQEQNHPWLRKPIRIQELLKTLQRSDELIENELQSETPSSKHAKLKVLLAEDNIVNQKVAQYILEKLGCDADLAVNGKEAVHLLSGKDYDVILMDIQMPEIDGLEATQLIRSDPEMQQPYIIAMTANVMEDDRLQCIEAGMDDFIPKPVRIDDVSRAMERAHLQISQNLIKNKTIEH